MNKIEEIIMHNYNPSLLVGRGSRHLPKDTLMRAEKEKKEDLIAIQGMVRELETYCKAREKEAYEQGVYDQAMYWEDEVEDGVRSFAKRFEGKKFDMADVEIWLESGYGKK